MERREFLIKTATSGAALAITGFALIGQNINKPTKNLTYKALPKWRGFNLQEKFTHKPDEWRTLGPEWGFRNEPFRESDFALIRELGFNYVRLPMSYKCWCEEDNWYKLKEKHLKEIDQAVEFGKQYDIHVCINFHRAPGYTICNPQFPSEYQEKTSVWDDEETLNACAFHWNHFAERYKGIPNSRLTFNLFNEPTRTTQEKHDHVIRHLVSGIRAIDPNRLIVIDGFNFLPDSNLIDLNVVQSARGYIPQVVTHYKSTWNAGNDTLPTWPMKDHEGLLWDKNQLSNVFLPWKELENKEVGVFVGEFGVYNKTPHEVTLAFLKDNLDIWKAYNWGWAMWCFRGSFGVADSGRQDVKYEKYKGILLDRKMLELLKRY